MFNVSDKLLVSLDILLEFREFFKKGQPIGNIISAKLLTLKAKCREVYIIIVYYSLTIFGASLTAAKPARQFSHAMQIFLFLNFSHAMQILQIVKK